MENQEKQTQEKMGFIYSKTAKLIMVGMLTLVLLIPLFFVQDLISERSRRSKEVISEVADLWGREIEFYGPILKIPYRVINETTVVDAKTKQSSITRTASIEYAYFFPNSLKNKTVAKKNTSLKRGIYNNVVYTADMNFEGEFGKPNFEKLDIKPEDVIWEKASILVKTTNLKSIKSELKINLNNQKLSFESKSDDDNYYGSLESTVFDYKTIATDDKIDFKFAMKYNGSDRISFIPIGKNNTTSIDSDWESPSFVGNFAANDTTKTISKKGFHADWTIIDINRPFSQQYASKLPDLSSYSYGVKLIETVDQYQQNERSAKYGFLVIGLTFLLFFLIQTISKINIHIFQYCMIGLALIMFYTLLISITEHSSFSLAYLVAAVSVILMIGFYSISILKDKKFPLFIGISLTILYSFIFVIIQLEEYALLVGSIGLFFILGSVMYVSRKIDWNS